MSGSNCCFLTCVLISQEAGNSKASLSVRSSLWIRPQLGTHQRDQTSHSKGNQPWIFIGKPESPILWPPAVKSQLIGKDPDAGKDWGRRRRGWQRKRWLDSITVSMEMNLSKLQEIVEEREAWCASVHEVEKNQTWLNYWTATTTTKEPHCWGLLPLLLHALPYWEPSLNSSGAPGTLSQALPLEDTV